jgi:chitodextrinase
MKKRAWLFYFFSLLTVNFAYDLSAQNTSVYVSPHPDDWQLFMNPNAYRSLTDLNQKVIFLHITSGDGGRGAGHNLYYQAREEGSLRAIRFLVNNISGVPGYGPDMNSTTVTVNGHRIQRYSYGNAVAYFVRLPDGNIDGSGYPITNYQSIRLIHDGGISRIMSIDSVWYNSLNDLETTLRTIIQNESSTGTLTFNLADTDNDLNGGDHSDHLYSSIVMQEVAGGIGNVTANLYREYVTSALAPNLSGDDLLVSVGTWGATNSGLSDKLAYSTWDNVHNVWLDKQYFRTISVTDIIAPSIPSNLQATVVSGSRINLSWTASTDNGMVAGYRIYRNGSFIGTSPATNYSDTGLVSATVYTYSVLAFDGANNQSALCPAITSTTLDNVAPSMPSGVQATATSASSVLISWTASTDNLGVTGYEIYRNNTLLSTTTSTSYSNLNLIPRTTYLYRVCAYDAAGNRSTSSNNVSVTTLASSDTISPSVPASLTPSNITANSVNLSWSSSIDNIGVEGYHIFVNGTLRSSSPSTSYSVGSLISGVTYTFAVSAYDSAGNTSALSGSINVTTIDNVVPSVPASLSATNTTATSITLSWAAASDNVGVTGYRIFRNGSLVGTSASTVFTDNLLTSGVTYTYTVQSLDAANNISAQSQPINIITLDNVAPGIPAGLGATATSTTSINLSWTASTDNVAVAGYRIYRNGTLLTSSTSTNYTDNGLTTNTSYSYAISAYDAAGNQSSLSSSAIATTLAVPINIALNKPTTTSAYEYGHDGSYANDGVISTSSWWGASPYPQWWTVDLQNAYLLNRVLVVNYYDGSRYYRYNIQVSLDGSSWTSLIDFSSNSTPATISGNSFDVNNVMARYIRVNMTYNSANTGVHIVEFGAYGTQVSVEADNIAPSVPTGLAASALSANSINLTWNASTDNLGVAGYRIYRNGTLVANTASTSYTDNSLNPATTYSYSVLAYDAASNTSALSGSASATTSTLPANIALNKPSSSSGAEYGHQSSLANDGVVSSSNWWGANPYPQWWMVDLEAVYEVNRVVIVNYYDGVRYYRYTIEASLDGTSWSTIVNNSTNTTPAASSGVSFTINNVQARYLRVNMTYNSANVGVHIVEFEAYGSLVNQTASMLTQSSGQGLTLVSSLPTASGSIILNTIGATRTQVNGNTSALDNALSVNDKVSNEKYFLSAFPNPVKRGEPINLHFNVLQDENVKVEIFNTLGGKIMSEDVSLVEGGNKVKLNPIEGKGGIYFIATNINGKREIQKLIVE